MEINANQKIIDIKNKLTELYNKKKDIHVNIVEGRKKIKSTPCKITGVYTNFICVESNVNGYMENFTIPYRDIMIKKILIDELN